jgi:hypothetical protein
MPEGESVTGRLRRAVEIALAGDWQSAHEIAQEHEDDRNGQWLHAIVHRMEGDLDNARYWYGRCGRTLPDGVGTQEELKQIEAALAEG